MKMSWESAETDHRRNCRVDAVGMMFHHRNRKDAALVRTKYATYDAAVGNCRLKLKSDQRPIDLMIQVQRQKGEDDPFQTWSVTRWKAGKKLLHANPADAADLELRDAAVVRGLRAALPPGVVVTSDVAFQQDSLTALLTELNLDPTFAETFVPEESLLDGRFTPSELQGIYRQMREWCELPEPERLRWTAKKVCVMRIGPDAKGEPPSEHPVPEGTLTVVALRDLERGTFLGNYAGEFGDPELTRNTAYKETFAYPPEQAYTTTADGAVDESLKRKAKMTMDGYCIDGLKYRNFMALVNDYNGYEEVITSPKPGGMPQIVLCTPSLMFFEFWLRGMPQIGAVLQRSVRKGSELTADYGGSFWWALATVPSADKVQHDAKVREEILRAETEIALPRDFDFATIDDVGLGLMNGIFKGVLLLVEADAWKPDAAASKFVGYLLQNAERYHILRCYGGPPEYALSADRENSPLDELIDEADLIIVIGRTQFERTKEMLVTAENVVRIYAPGRSGTVTEMPDLKKLIAVKGSVDDVVCRLAYAMAIEDIIMK